MRPTRDLSLTRKVPARISRRRRAVAAPAEPLADEFVVSAAYSPDDPDADDVDDAASSWSSVEGRDDIVYAGPRVRGDTPEQY